MFSRRTLLSLAQYLELQGSSLIEVLLEKHGLSYQYGSTVKELADVLSESSDAQVLGLLGEVVRTDLDLRSRVQPRYRYDTRCSDLHMCLLLDGYTIADSMLIPLDPGIVETQPFDDDLTAELVSSDLSEADAIKQKLIDSVEAFRSSNPDFNATLNNARVALQTLATAIAKVRVSQYPGNFEEKKWGSVLNYLQISGFLTQEQEKGLAGAFGFVSPGSHVPIGLTEKEATRLGRSLILAMCWFLIKRYKEARAS
jgi:hypothetical protein